MVLTDRQRADLHAGIYEYLKSRSGDAFADAAAAIAKADPEACRRHTDENYNSNNGENNNNTDEPQNGHSKSSTPILEKKWTAIPRLQKKVLELERQAAYNAKIHAHRGPIEASSSTTERRMLPRMPCQYTLQGHAAVVTTVAVHPVFTIVASGSEDGTIKLWDHESGDYIRTLKGHTNTVNSVSFTPTGSHLASCSTDLSIKVWDVNTYACLRTLRGHDHTISSVRFLPQPSLVNSEEAAGATSSSSTGLDLSAMACQFLLTASRDHTVKVWDLETGFCEQTLTHHNDWVRCLAVRVSDGQRWASAGNDTVIYVYDSSRQIVNELRGHEQVVESLAFVTEDGASSNTNGSSRVSKHVETVRDYLASGSRDRTVRLWKVSDGTSLAVWAAHDNWVRSVLIHPNGNYVISSADDKSIRVFDIKASRCLRTLENAHSHFVTSLDMHSSLPVLVSGSVDQTVRCWNLD